ncbi:unnamed protein product [Calypogeia fissa]
MDGGRYVLQQADWDNSSALESYEANHDSDLRAGAAYAGGGYLEGGFERDRGYPREFYSRDILYDREIYGMGPAVLGLWPPAKRRNIEDDIAIFREVHRHEKVGYVDNFRDYGYEKVGRCTRDSDSYDGEEYEYVRKSFHGSREGSRDVELDFPPRHRGSDSDRERSWREKDRRQRKERDWNRSRSRDRDRDWSPHEAEYNRDRHRSRSVSYDERSRRSRSHRSRSRGWREDSMENVVRQKTPRTDRRRDREGRSSNHERTTLAPSATLVVKGLSQKTVEDDLYHALADWGPLRHVRVIKERNSGVSRGFAFVDFPSMEAAQKMMDSVGYDGLVVDGRRLFFEYSSKPTGALGTPQGGVSGRGRSSRGATGVGADWMCTVCGCVNFARRTLCFQCNEGRADDAPAADAPVSTGPASGGRRSSEAGPTHVLVVRGLDENIDEEILRFEFSKYAPIKDLRLVRDKFTQVSRGFAFIHFNTVHEATKALEASNGTALEKNGQLLRVAFAKSIYGPGSLALGATSSHGSQAAAAAIEAATFAQQYDNTGWAPKEYNPVSSGYTHGANHRSTPVTVGKDGEQGPGRGPRLEAEFGSQGSTDAPGSDTNKSGSAEYAEAPQSGFVWDEASGYYYDAASGFYYDGHRGLYYDGNTGLWYTYDQATQQYAQCVDSVTENAADVVTDSTKSAVDNTADGNVSSKAVITARASVSLEVMEKKPTLAEAVTAAAVAAQVAAKKEKERMKEKERESRVAGKGPLMVSKKKISNAMNQWKQRQSETQAVQGPPNDASSLASAPVPSDTIPPTMATYGGIASHQANSSKSKLGNPVKDSWGSSLGRGGSPYTGVHTSVGAGRAKPIVSGTSIMNNDPRVTTGIATSNLSVVGLGSGFTREAGRVSIESGGSLNTVQSSELVATTPFKTNASALGSYGPMAGTKRRFTETPQTGYRDRAAERRTLYGSAVLGENSLEVDLREKGLGVKGRALDMPFPPGVGAKSGGNAALAGPEAQSFEVVTAEKAIDERNVGNRMLRNMGWQEGLGLGKGGTGIVEPVQAQGTGERAGLGSASQRKLDSRFETQPGDTYRVVIQKKALARFHEMI